MARYENRIVLCKHRLTRITAVLSLQKSICNFNRSVRFPRYETSRYCTSDAATRSNRIPGARWSGSLSTRMFLHTMPRGLVDLKQDGDELQSARPGRLTENGSRGWDLRPVSLNHKIAEWRFLSERCGGRVAGCASRQRSDMRRCFLDLH